MKRIIISALTLLLFGGLNAQSVENREYSMMLSKLLDHNVNEVSVTDIDLNDKVIYLDAREKNEYNVSHVKNAIWVGYDKFQKDSITGIDKTKKIVVYCSVGYRSEKISERLIKMGYTNVSNLYGDLFEWSNQEMPLVTSSNNDSTVKIQPYNEKWGKWIIVGEKSYE